MNATIATGHEEALDKCYDTLDKELKGGVEQTAAAQHYIKCADDADLLYGRTP